MMNLNHLEKVLKVSITNIKNMLISLSYQSCILIKTKNIKFN